MPISNDLILTDVPSWRRVTHTLEARIKHWFGRHTYVDTLFPVIDDGLLVAVNVSRECWVCGRLA